jgi:crotonobetainyl-CoA:carnitine CoA-transferase CaiB-like acyl-CoA transferase
MLEGIRIIEIEGLGPAPFAGMTLADLGAEVIVVHRDTPPLPGAPERSIVDRGKKSVILDLKDARDKDRLRRLVATADGLIEGFRPGVMERLDLGPAELLRENPRLVYGRITGWGQEGPRSADAGHDLNYVALSGALWYASPPGSAPFTPPTLVGDIGGGAMYLVAGMLAGLLRAKTSGRGTVVDAAIVDGSAHMMNLLMAGRTAGLVRPERGSSMMDGPPWSRCYRCADGQWLSVQCLEPRFYEVFLDKLGLAGDPAFGQTPTADDWPALGERFAAIFAGQPVRHWEALFENSDACVAPVREPSASACDPHMAARRIWLEVGGELQARAAPRFDGRVPADPQPGPARGEHTAEIFDNL